MNFYSIIVQNKEKNCETLYSTLLNLGDCSIYYGFIILKSKKSLGIVTDTIKKILDESDKWQIQQIKNADDIQDKTARDYILREQFLYESYRNQLKLEKNMKQLSKLLDIAQKYLDKGGGAKNGDNTKQ